jgi:hypothetical protein
MSLARIAVPVGLPPGQQFHDPQGEQVETVVVAVDRGGGRAGHVVGHVEDRAPQGRVAKRVLPSAFPRHVAPRPVGRCGKGVVGTSRTNDRVGRAGTITNAWSRPSAGQRPTSPTLVS